MTGPRPGGAVRPGFAPTGRGNRRRKGGRGFMGLPPSPPPFAPFDGVQTGMVPVLITVTTRLRPSLLA